MSLGGRADSTIRVNIIGDADSLAKAAAKGERAVGGFGASVGKVAAGLGALFAADQVFEFAQSALGEADRIGDAMDRLEGQIGTDLTAAIDDAADSMAHLGQSRQDVLELAAAFADTATALGIGAPSIAAWADDAASIAAALALQGIGDAASNIDTIGKAAGGSERALRELGINLDVAAVEARALQDSGKDTPAMLTDSEIAAARYALILETLQARLGDTSAANQDLEQSQAELGARWETLTGMIGEGLEGPLNDLLTWMIDGIEGLGLMVARWDDFTAGLRKALGPIGDVAGALFDLLGTINDVITGLQDIVGGKRAAGLSGASGQISGAPGGGGGTSARFTSVNVYGGDPAEVERAVRRAATDYAERNGATFPV